MGLEIRRDSGQNVKNSCDFVLVVNVKDRYAYLTKTILKLQDVLVRTFHKQTLPISVNYKKNMAL